MGSTPLTTQPLHECTHRSFGFGVVETILEIRKMNYARLPGEDVLPAQIPFKTGVSNQLVFPAVCRVHLAQVPACSFQGILETSIGIGLFVKPAEMVYINT